MGFTIRDNDRLLFGKSCDFYVYGCAVTSLESHIDQYDQ